MDRVVTYDIKLRWMNYIGMTPETSQVIINDINSFSPTVPIPTIESIFVISVSREDDGSFVNIRAQLDCTKYCENEPIENYYSIIDEIVIGRIKDLLFAMNLAYPGHIHIYSSILYRNEEPVESLSYATDISGLAYTGCPWISYENLSIKQCWDWLISKTNFLSYISRTPIDRALHALSYEHSTNEDAFIFYVLLGIEAIYNDSSNREDSISAQLKRKVQSVIGTLPPKAIKEMNQMYKRRSALVHGDANIFKGWHSVDYTEEEYTIVEDERDFMVTATGILIATIQRFIKANANTLVESVTVSLKSQPTV